MVQARCTCSVPVRECTFTAEVLAAIRIFGHACFACGRELRRGLRAREENMDCVGRTREAVQHLAARGYAEAHGARSKTVFVHFRVPGPDAPSASIVCLVHDAVGVCGQSRADAPRGARSGPVALEHMWHVLH